MEFRTTIPPTLVSELSKVFPDQWPDLSMPDREIWYRAGQASVVRLLEEAVQNQVNALSPLREV